MQGCGYITTRQLAKCENFSGLANKNTNPFASLARVIFPLSLTLSLFLARFFFLIWRVKIDSPCQTGECLEKTYPHP
jgi:hypothetical protein